ncbi:glutamate synthase-related protein [Sulfoacidibacillus thermotolerans]|uniref:Glutamate synthase n=1 Tax=Sulfoacidibacillus thermotolerans TaxID=1765684 RepID=A0A2U3DCP2_SULT2|nr:glutamate synthase-related protein [Sulfoacidibacillus thermotolerans]PWI59046.1 glutamate synthase [Sulfoacidibacillus thermotolerans]
MAFLEREEHDACGIVAWVEKAPYASRENVNLVLNALHQMRHRAGFVENEGDGCGILIDLPRAIWADHLSSRNLDPEFAYDPRFVVGHFILSRQIGEAPTQFENSLRSLASAAGFSVLAVIVDAVNPHVLGPAGAAEGIHFIQVALWSETVSTLREVAHACFELELSIEAKGIAHVASLSNSSVVYKVRGDSMTLQKYFADFAHTGLKSRITLGHNRYSTNTTTSSERVQPFSLLGHNGELNTIYRLREESRMLNIPTTPGGSDSQDLNRVIEGLQHRYGFTLLEALELVFPPIIHEIKHMPPHLQDLYMFMRSIFGPFAQGPAAIIARAAGEAVFSVDALGLRPLWMVETKTSIIFSSEQGVVPFIEMIHDPKPLSPGEKVYVELPDAAPTVAYSYHEAQQATYERMSERFHFDGYRHGIAFGGPPIFGEVHLTPHRIEEKSREALMGAFGWDVDDVRILEHHATTGQEPIRSLGFDGPLAILSDRPQNIADYLKEMVAVVTNPAIDREREIEHFSTRVVLGKRPNVTQQQTKTLRMELQSPILLGGHQLEEADLYRSLAHKLGTQLYEDVLRYFSVKYEDVVEIYPRVEADETLETALQRLRAEVIAAADGQANLIILDDRLSFTDDNTWIDPALAISVAHTTLRDYQSQQGENARRRSSLILRSGAVRNLHDLVVMIGLGADAVCPYLYFASAYDIDAWKGIENAYQALTKGLEKVLSTLGIHEVRGYDRLFSAIGLSAEVANILEIKSFFDENAHYSDFDSLLANARERAVALHAGKSAIARPYQLWPRIWKSAGDAAAGNIPYEEYSNKLQELEKKQPISLRHLLDIKKHPHAITPEQVSLAIGEHALPFVISSMSFGSQSEVAFRAYAIAATQLDMISMNGEGGEIKDMLGKYAKNRGHQIASGRFGVNAELCNSADLLEIKIGQGAKPGEGGHLPGSKVSQKVANARNARQGTDLISPSNNHDIYSIEDLAQMIDELKVVNPRAKISVKVPVVAGIGTIAVGIAKAGADIITLSGFDGGTGAARAHALKHVGLPIEIGVKLAHEALLEAGLRDMVELWCDGGMKNGVDVVKMVLLGANRVGFGTMAMIAIGCTSCRACHKDTCHVGIATQIETVEQATEHGLKAFVPRDIDTAVAQLTHFFAQIGKETQALVAQLGATSLQDLVGRSELLEQTRELERVRLDDLIVSHQSIQYSFAWKSPRASTVGVHSLTAQLGKEAVSAMAVGNEALQFGATHVQSPERVIGGMLSGSVVRREIRDRKKGLERASVKLLSGSIAGNGFGAYNARGVHLRVEGGAQDGVGKGAMGGKIVILKGVNRNGQRLDGSVGKGLAYGAQHGLFIVQGDADSRAGIRLSGADLIIGGEVTSPLDDSRGGLALRANIKGFAFEYMTGGRALVLGDPGPWICSGMTGGVVYLRVDPAMGLTIEALKRRLAKGAKVTLSPLNNTGVQDVQELISIYQKELVRSGQQREAERLHSLLSNPREHFVMVQPGLEQTEQDIATE